MAHIRTYQNHVGKLVKCLPMDDAHFITILSAQQLLPGDTENKIKTLSTQADKASYFLSHVIKPAIDINETSSFDKLVSIMQNCDYIHVQKLAVTIKCDIENEMKLQPDKIKPQFDETKSQLDKIKPQLDETKSQLDEVKSQPDEIKLQLDEIKLQPDEIKPQLEMKSQLDEIQPQSDELKPELKRQNDEIIKSGKNMSFTSHSQT